MKRSLPIFLGLVLFTLLGGCNNISSYTEQVYQIPAEIMALPTGTTLGLRAPEIELPNVDGEKMYLSSLQGKVVLVDFWASWCNPCRNENPILIKVFKKYQNSSFEKGEGFEIFSVSLDRDEKAWKEAIEADNLSWEYQLGDMQAAKSKPIQEYGIQMIPTNFLLDQNGVIIATNLRGEALGEKLEEMLVE
ncbi:MAG: TlpA disulfide reductase family protein [Bacteroidales bacterium]|jgi:thiol-disulfide isomerase/thioredoxin|nr:TlpA disulfide reductase family protein [Bacteroidales bacterium]